MKYNLIYQLADDCLVKTKNKEYCVALPEQKNNRCAMVASLLYSGTPHSIAGNAVLLKLTRRACDWEALSYEEAVALKIEIETMAEAYIQDELMQI